MRRLILIAVLALVVAAVRFGLQAENAALMEARYEGTEADASYPSSKSEISDDSKGFTLPKFSSFKKNHAKAMALTVQDQPLMAACQQNFEAQGLSFPGKITLNDGCACMAKYASHQVAEAQYSDFVSHHAMILTRQRMRDLSVTPAAIKIANEQNDRIYDAVKAKSTMASQEFDQLYRKAADIHATCSAPATYRAEGLAKIAALGQAQGGPVDADAVSLRGTSNTLSASAK